MSDYVRAQAELELKEEYFREAVDKYKVKLRARGRFWKRLFPWRIIFVRLTDV